MTDLAQATANTAPKHPVLLATPGDSLLPLSQCGPVSGPFTVNVKIANDHAEFSCNGGPSYTDGLLWTFPKGASAAAITFAFGTPTITRLISKTAGLTFLAPTPPGQVGRVTAVPGTYDFDIEIILEDGTLHVVPIDPKIVVTPLP